MLTTSGEHGMHHMHLFTAAAPGGRLPEFSFILSCPRKVSVRLTRDRDEASTNVYRPA